MAVLRESTHRRAGLPGSALTTVDPLRTATSRAHRTRPRRREHTRGSLARIALLLAVMTLPLTACAAGSDAGVSVSPPAVAPTPSVTPTLAPPADAGAGSQNPSAPASAVPDPSRAFPAEGIVPASLDIPSINLTDDLISLGIQADGSMQVPEDWQQTGWFTGGGRPGGRGPTVLAGHVDSPTGPAAFARLHELAPGDEVRVTDVTGTVHIYVVSEVSSHAKADFPTADVFGVIPRDELRLITCGGIFDQASGHYEDNLVVHAVRA